MAVATTTVAIDAYADENWHELSTGEDNVIVQGAGVDIALAEAAADLSAEVTRYGHQLTMANPVASFTGLVAAGLNVYAKAVNAATSVVVTKY